MPAFSRVLLYVYTRRHSITVTQHSTHAAPLLIESKSKTPAPNLKDAATIIAAIRHRQHRVLPPARGCVYTLERTPTARGLLARAVATLRRVLVAPHRRTNVSRRAIIERREEKDRERKRGALCGF